jgi:putative MATE family efflux protein
MAEDSSSSTDRLTVPCPEAVDGIALAPPAPPILTGTGRSTWRVVLMLAWPVLLQQFLVLAVQLSDRFLAGHYEATTPQERVEALGHRLMSLGQLGGGWASGASLGGLLTAETSWQAAEQALSRQASYQAAQTTAFYLTWLLSSYTILVTVGSTALVARSVGARDYPAAVHITNQSLLLAGCLGVLGSVLGLTLIETVVWLLNLRGETLQFAVAYLQPPLLLLVFQVIELAGIACLVGAGDTRTGLWVMSGVTVVNLPLAWGLCLGVGPLPELGFVGISTGTALSHVLGGLVVLGVLLRGRHGLRLRIALLRPDWSILRRLLRISIPAGVDSLSLVLCQLWFLSIVNRLGDVAGSAHGIAIGWEALGYLSGNAFGVAAMALVGQNLGARQPQRAAHSGWVAFATGCLVMSLMGVTFYALARPMFQLFCPYPSQAEIIDVGVPVLRLVAFAMPALASSIIFTNALRGAGDTTFPVFFTWMGFLLVRIPLAYWLTLPELHLGPLGKVAGWDLGLRGAWLAMCADLLLRGVLFLLRFGSGAWKRIEV